MARRYPLYLKKQTATQSDFHPTALRILRLQADGLSHTPEGWERGMEDLWLAPSELEAVLLEAAARMVRGREEEAWELWQAVRRYPKAHHWRERVEALIAPQTAMLGIWLSLQGRRGIGQPVFAFAREALEMLRRNNSHSYLLPLLELMGRMRPRDGAEAELTICEPIGQVMAQL